jgi:hypothetical protein
MNLIVNDFYVPALIPRIRNVYRDRHEFKNGKQPSTNLVGEENGDLLANSHNILNSWKNYFCQILNVHRLNDVRQI